MERSIESGQGARVGLGDYTEQDRIGKRSAKSDHNRKDVQGKNDFIKLNGHEHARILLV